MSRLPEAHHFIGAGPISAELSSAASHPEALSPQIAAMIGECGLTVVSESSAAFPGGGATLVWILAESHLVLHLWTAEGFATVDLHVCDFRASNEAPARRLKQRLSELCFAGGEASWSEVSAPHPASARTA